jgi:hypothetical protein
LHTTPDMSRRVCRIDVNPLGKQKNGETPFGNIQTYSVQNQRRAVLGAS